MAKMPRSSVPRPRPAPAPKPAQTRPAASPAGSLTERQRRRPPAEVIRTSVRMRETPEKAK